MDIQIENINKILNSAQLIQDSKDYTSATRLFFKSMFMVVDYIILREQGRSPKDHTDRFRITESDYPDLYNILDKYFSIYRNTYSSTISKEVCHEIKVNTFKIIERYKIPLNNK